MNQSSESGQRMARAGAAAVQIARGALSGGLYGAAAGAVKSFFPQLMKGVAAVLIAALLLPMLVFTALPNILFGFASATDPGTVAFTTAAQGLYSLYQQLDRLNGLAVDRLVATILPDFIVEGVAQFTGYEVETDLGNTNLYWLVAIGCVEYEQDVFAMDEESILDLLSRKLSYTTRLAGGLLTISVWDLNPEGFMDALGFSDQQRDWAGLLYSTMSEDQSAPLDDGDTGYPDRDYSDVTLTDMDTPVVYYNQTDARWGSLPYGKTGSIAAEGCGPTALAIVVASLTAQQVTPLDVARWSAASGHRCEGNGSYHSLIPDGGRHYGLTVTGIGSDAARLTAALSEGKLVIALMSKGHFTNGGHFIVLRGITAQGEILVADPASVRRSQQAWALSIIVNEARRGAAAGGPFWVFSAQ